MTRCADQHIEQLPDGLRGAVLNALLRVRAQPTEAGTPLPTTRRGRQVEGGVTVPIRHVRAQHAARLSVLHAVDDYTLEDASFSRDRTLVRASWQTVTAHTYGY